MSGNMPDAPEAGAPPLKAFLTGLVTPSGLALSVALTICVAALLATLLITPAFVANVAAWIGGSQRQSADVYVVTSRAIRLAAEKPTRPMVVLLGGSTSRESVDETLARRLLSHQGFAFSDFTGSAQTIFESAALTDVLPPNFRGVVVVGVNPQRMGRPLEREFMTHPRYGIDSPTLRREIAAAGLVPPSSTGVYAVDQRAFLLRLWGDLNANMRWLPLTSREPRRHWYQDLAPMEKGKMLSQLARKRFADYDLQARHNLLFLRHLAASLRKRHIALVLLETPANPLFVAKGIGPARYAHHVAGMEQFTRAEGLAYINLNKAARLSSSQFYDWGHLRDAAATQRITRLMVARLGPLLQSARSS